MSSLVPPGEAIAQPEPVVNSTLVDDIIPTASSLTVSVISSAAESLIEAIETLPPVGGIVPSQTSATDIDVTDISLAPPTSVVDVSTASSSSSLILSTTTPTPTTGTEPTATVPAVFPLADDEEESQDDEGVVENPGTAPSPIFEELPSTSTAEAVEDAISADATSADVPAQSTAPVDEDITETETQEPAEPSSPAETSPPTADVTPDQDSRNDSPDDNTRISPEENDSAEEDEVQDEDRRENEEAVEEVDEVVEEEQQTDENRDNVGPDELNDDSGEIDRDQDDGALVGDITATAITSTLTDDSTPTTLPSGAETTVRLDTAPSIPESDLRKGLPSETASSDSAVDGSPPPTAIIAGGVVGGVAGLALVLGLLIWCLKRRAEKRHTYVIKTPVFEPPKTGSTEKTWEFDNASVGPTPRSAKLAEAVNNHWAAVGKLFKLRPAPASNERRQSRINMNRGNSQFIDTLPAPAHSRHSSVRSEAFRHPEQPQNETLFTKWWSRAKMDTESQPDMRNKRSMGKRSSSEAATSTRRPLDLSNSKASSEDFAGALGLMLNRVGTSPDNPFSDSNQVGRTTSTHIPNPFADSYAVNETRLYDERAQRPRGSTTGSILQPPQVFARPGTSALEIRSNVRSDQFDLEIDARDGSFGGNPANADVFRRPSMARIGRDSYTSRIASTASLGSLDGWGEPGPDIGPGSFSQSHQNPRGLPHIGEAM